ncbi:MAG TPA: TolC family protein [Bryobacteraceae bacterium]|jgi:outer membrane protein TolC|nr:TolC family protein [Bryobacteraceae bacterium]
MTAIFRCSVTLLALGLAVAPMRAQTAVRIDPSAGKLEWLTRPYRARYIPPINLANSSRFDSLIRAGNLYVSAQDVVALALENNIDIEVQRYGPLLARELLRRAESGSLLRNVGQNVAAGPTSVSLSGVSVNTNGAPLGGGGAGVSAGGGIITQLGPNLLSLDPTIVGIASFSHSTSPQSLTSLTGTNALIDNVKSFTTYYTQNWLTGTTATLTYASTYNRFNSASYSLNPFTSGDIDLTITQNLLNGFGRAVNGRNIRVQKNNMKATDLQFKQQVITTVTAVLNLYWDLVSFNQDVKAKQEEVATAEQLLQNNKDQVRIGTLAEIEVTRAQSQLYAARQDLVISQTNLLQQETVLKNALSRQGIATSDLAEVHVIPLDTITIPGKDELPAVNDLVNDALKNRLEVEQAKINLDSDKLNLVGIKNSLKPTLQVFAELTNNGLTGSTNVLGLAPGVPPPSGTFVGNYGNMLGQIFQRDYPNYSAGLSLNIPLRNRAAQADYATSLIEIRQHELNYQKQVNQVRVDVQNAVIGMQQARARYDAAVQAQNLSQATFDADKKKYELGAGTPYQVVQDQRDLASAQSSEAQAMANYSHARIALDQALGRTLEVNHISMAEAVAGRVGAPPSVPPQEVKQ